MLAGSQRIPTSRSNKASQFQELVAKSQCFPRHIILLLVVDAGIVERTRELLVEAIYMIEQSQHISIGLETTLSTIIVRSIDFLSFLLKNPMRRQKRQSFKELPVAEIKSKDGTLRSPLSFPSSFKTCLRRGSSTRKDVDCREY